jgi:hypothetical protein
VGLHFEGFEEFGFGFSELVLDDIKGKELVLRRLEERVLRDLLIPSKNAQRL